jgi:hypothetical protein
MPGVLHVCTQYANDLPSLLEQTKIAQHDSVSMSSMVNTIALVVKATTNENAHVTIYLLRVPNAHMDGYIEIPLELWPDKNEDNYVPITTRRVLDAAARERDGNAKIVAIYFARIAGGCALRCPSHRAVWVHPTCLQLHIPSRHLTQHTPNCIHKPCHAHTLLLLAEYKTMILKADNKTFALHASEQCAKDFAKCVGAHNLGASAPVAGVYEGTLTVTHGNWSTRNKIYATLEESKDGAKHQVRCCPDRLVLCLPVLLHLPCLAAAYLHIPLTPHPPASSSPPR